MASVIEKNGSPYWWASYRDAAGHQHTKSTKVLRQPADPKLAQTNRDAAQSTADMFEQQAKGGLPVGIAAIPLKTPAAPAAIPNFKDFTRDWVSGVGGGEKYRVKLNGYFDHIDQFLGAKISWPICRLHRPDYSGLAPFILQMGYSPTTVTLHLKTLRQALRAALAQGFVLVCPITPKDYIVNPSPIGPRAMSALQIECLANATMVIDWRTAILFGFYAGMDLMPAVSLGWDQINFQAKKVSWISFNRAGKPIEMAMPLHPVLENHLVLLRKAAVSEVLMPSLHGLNHNVLRARFRSIVQISGLLTQHITSGMKREYSDLQFSSLKLSFAREMGHAGLFLLSKYLRSIEFQDLAAKIATLPNLNLKPHPLLA